MSELTRCNFCSHQESLRYAEQKGWLVTVLPDNFGMGGYSEYIHPKDIVINKLSKREREQYKGSWYMQLPDHCCC